MPAERDPLPLARNRLADAVHAFADPQPIWIGGRCRWQPSLYSRLRDALTPRNQYTQHRVPGSRPPCRTDALVLVIECDMTLGEWQPDGDGAIERLHRLRERQWTPDEVEQIQRYADQILRWTATAVELLGDRPPTVALRLPCPSCGRKHVNAHNGAGEPVRRWALQVNEREARCLGCDSTWTSEQFAWLAKLLGCPALPVA